MAPESAVSAPALRRKNARTSSSHDVATGHSRRIRVLVITQLVAADKDTARVTTHESTVEGPAPHNESIDLEPAPAGNSTHPTNELLGAHVLIDRCRC